MAVSNEKIPCTKCKAKGVAMCDGCQESFCTTHFMQHHQELSLKMDSIGQNYDLLRRDLSEGTKKHPLLVRVNDWERDSIKKIQKAAETARADLEKLLDKTKIDVESSVTKIIEEIRASRDSNDFTENEFIRWTTQLDELRQAFESPFNVTIQNDDQKETVISLIKICDQQKSPYSPLTPVLENHFLFVEKPNIFVAEKFDPKTDAILSENNLIATCHPKYRSPGAIVYGFNSYSSGSHDISFRIEKKGLSRLFFGIYSSLKKRVDTISSGSENSVYGWWDIDSAVLNGTKQDSSNEHIISMGDKVVLTLDCDHQQIQLYHVRENRQVQLPIDLHKCPFPWQIIVKLTANGDCVRLL
jgi:hypothetical protein